MSNLRNINILLGVCGGIAAYKSAELIRLLKKAGADVRVVLTEGGHQFITPLTLQALSGNKVHENIFDQETELQMSHIDLARWADLVVIAPATADCMAKLASGLAQDLLTTVCLATVAPVKIVPAMNQQMWQHAATQKNISILTELGYTLLGPASGDQACGETGPGRMIEPEDILDELELSIPQKKLQNKRVLITAGPTQEPIDNVRYISNHSSGKMGFAIAQAAASQGAQVTLITGPTNLLTTPHIKRIDVITATEMYEQVMQQVVNHDIFICAAAVADYQCINPAQTKIKKTQDTLNIELEKTDDIISEVAKITNRPLIIGFAAETSNLVANAQEKLTKKNMDMIVANLVSDPSIGFNSDDNEVTVITKNNSFHLAKQSKKSIAMQLINLIVEQFMK